MLVVRVGVVENGLLESLNLGVHLVSLDFGLELGEVVDGTLAVSCGDNVLRVLANVFGDLAPGGFYSSDRVGKSAILETSTHWKS